MKESTFEEKYFTENYDGNYDKRNPNYKFISYVKFINKNTSNKKNLLDIGCAYGSFLKEAQKYYEVTGSDISVYAVNIAKSRVPKAINIFASDAIQIPSNQKYDIITSFDVLEHVGAIDKLLQHIDTLLNDDGVLTIAIPVYDTFIGKLVKKLDKDPTHIHKNARYWWLKKLQENGYEVIVWKGIWRYYLPKIGYLHMISNLTRSISPAIIIMARKTR